MTEQINPADMVVAPHLKINPLGSETPIGGTETPYRKTPPTNMGSAAEATATGTPPVAAGQDQATAVPSATPVNTVVPAVTGTAQVAAILTCAPGTWVPASTTNLFQWFRNDVAINGATGNTRTLTSADLGAMMSCRVTGTIATYGGSSPVQSNRVGPVIA